MIEVKYFVALILICLLVLVVIFIVNYLKTNAYSVRHRKKELSQFVAKIKQGELPSFTGYTLTRNESDMLAELVRKYSKSSVEKKEDYISNVILRRSST